MPIQQSFVLNPVTAIKPYSVWLGDGTDYKQLKVNLVGEGNYLKIYNAETAALIGVRQIFKSQQIHGIALHKIRVVGWPDILIWGGRSYTLLTDSEIAGIVKGDTDDLDKWGAVEKFAPDWILDGAFSDDEGYLACVFITAHSAAFYVRLCESKKFTQLVPSVSGSILYSATLLWTSYDSIIVAAGTVFGDIEIITWILDPEGKETGGGEVLQTFRGHEGSIFGVAFSAELHKLAPWSGVKYVASCSDDRTIRIWDLSEVNLDSDGHAARTAHPNVDQSTTKTIDGQVAAQSSNQDIESGSGERDTGFGEHGDDTDSGNYCLAKVMGHSSRIWGVDFIHAYDSSGRLYVNVLSFGEDCTVQQWVFDAKSSSTDLQKPPKDAPPCTFELKHAKTYTHHTGKHIWSHSIEKLRGKQFSNYGYEWSGGNYALLTGGADGAIAKVTVKVQTPDLNPDQEMLEGQTNTKADGSVYPNPQIGLRESYGLNYSSDQLLSQFTKTIEPVVAETGFENALPVDSTDATSPPTATQKKKKKKKAKKPATEKKDAFNKYVFVGDSLLFTTTFGKVMVQHTKPAEFKDITYPEQYAQREYKISVESVPRKDDWEEVLLPEGSDDALASYSVTASAGEHGVFLGGAKGHIFYYRPNEPIALVANLQHKVAGLFYLPSFMEGFVSVLITFLGQAHAVVMAFRTSDVMDQTRFEIDLPPSIAVTGVGVLSGKLILGARHGALAVFDPRSSKKPLPRSFVYSFPCNDAITSIVAMPDVEGRAPHIVVTIRNGRFAIFEVQSSETAVVFKIVHNSMLPFGPMIEAAMFCGESLVICGFRSEHFIAWNETEQREIMSVKCGGAHRNFAYCPPTEAKAGGIFAYTKASELCIHEQVMQPYTKFKEGGHGREMKAAAVSDDQRFIATAAEDTNIRIWSYAEQHDPVKNKLESHAVLRKHSAGVQHLQWAEAANGQKVLFSAGGYEELMVWFITEIPGFGLGVLCKDSLDDLSEERDLRIMSFHAVAVGGDEGEESTFMIAIAFSDSTIRAYFYSRSKGFEKLATGRYTSSCLLQVQILPMPTGETLILTGCTDGHLQLWGLGEEEDACGAVDLVFKQRVQVHQSSILAFDILPVGPTDFIIATGGDDNAVAITLLGEQGFGMRTSLPSAHAAAVSGLTFVAHSHDTAENAGTFRFCTVGGDQVVKKFTVAITAEVNEGKLQIKEMKWHEIFEGDEFRKGDVATTTVSDAAGILTFGGHCSHKQCMVYGNGLEIFEV